MKEVPVFNSRPAIVDDADYEAVSEKSWHLRGGRPCAKIGGKQVSMYRFLLGESSPCIDHINGDPFDNRRQNLRCCTQAQNLMNRAPKKNGTSQYKGVSWIKKSKKWSAAIALNGVTHSLGMFVDELEAAKAYDSAAIKLYGEFARLNLAPPKTVPHSGFVPKPERTERCACGSEYSPSYRFGKLAGRFCRNCKNRKRRESRKRAALTAPETNRG